MSNSNIFVVMGFSPEDAAVHAIRSDLAAAIAKHLSTKDVKQSSAARMLGLTQAAVSNITRGKVEHLSIERLLRAMVHAGIPGFAEWPSADGARGGIRATASTTHTVTGKFATDLRLDSSASFAKTAARSDIAYEGL